MAALLAYIRGLIGQRFRGSSPVLVLVCRSKYSRYFIPSLSVLRTTPPQRSPLCSLYPRRPKRMMLLPNCVQQSLRWACSEQLSIKQNFDFLISKSCRCCFWSVSTSMSFRFLLLGFQSISGFLEFAVFENGFALTGKNQMAFDACQNWAQRWRFIFFSWLGSCSQNKLA